LLVRRIVMFLKRSIGGHHVIVRVGLGLVVGCAVALGIFLIYLVAQRVAL
jgi:hypothetical protein